MDTKRFNLKKLLTGTSANQLAFFNMLGPIILNGVNFFTVPVFTRMLGTENYGVVSLYTTWVQVLTIVMGIQTCGTIAAARVHIDKKELDAFYSSILSLSCLVSAVLTVLIVIFINPIAAFMQFNKIVVLLIVAQSFGAYVINFVTMNPPQAGFVKFLGLRGGYLSVGISFFNFDYEYRHIRRPLLGQDYRLRRAQCGGRYYSRHSDFRQRENRLSKRLLAVLSSAVSAVDFPQSFTDSLGAV